MSNLTLSYYPVTLTYLEKLKVYFIISNVGRFNCGAYNVVIYFLFVEFKFRHTYRRKLHFFFKNYNHPPTHRIITAIVTSTVTLFELSIINSIIHTIRARIGLD